MKSRKRDLLTISANLGGGDGELKKGGKKKKFITKDEEPQQYWQTAGERQGENPMKTPLPYIIIFGIIIPTRPNRTKTREMEDKKAYLPTRSLDFTYWSNGLLVHWSTGLRVYSNGLLVHWSTGLLVHWSTGLRVYWSNGLLV
ncbi:Unknown protein [Striga hermonthica]|uniref:Uncharacterized protein n=1 Tax=Striga hermonthica TaxID=68872 RepID=A0A9N7NSQ7_STRHE|nr:Unknown protein [Striga hermonthica]